MGNRRRFRYVSSGIANGDAPLSRFRLIGATNLRAYYDGDTVLRVQIPDDLVLTKYSCDTYSTTDDPRTLETLGYDVLIWHADKQRWKTLNQYKGTRLCDIPIYAHRR